MKVNDYLLWNVYLFWGPWQPHPPWTIQVNWWMWELWTNCVIFYIIFGFFVEKWTILWCELYNVTTILWSFWNFNEEETILVVRTLQFHEVFGIWMKKNNFYGAILIIYLWGWAKKFFKERITNAAMMRAPSWGGSNVHISILFFMLDHAKIDTHKIKKKH